jgi:hypothetical protein
MGKVRSVAIRLLLASSALGTAVSIPACTRGTFWLKSETGYQCWLACHQARVSCNHGCFANERCQTVCLRDQHACLHECPDVEYID